MIQPERREAATREIEAWYAGLRRYSGGFPARGSISGALVVLERLKEDFDLSIDAHTATGGSQIRGASGEAVRSILASFGETRRFVSEGGRTNRGLRGDIANMLKALASAGLDTLVVNERNVILDDLQGFLVDRVREFHGRQRLKVAYDPSKSTRQAISDLLANAREVGKGGQVAQYLVGAKLQLRFPDDKIGNESYSTADEQLGRPGDFLVGDTAFHVTVAPMPSVYDRCKQNLNDGYRTFLLVPENSTVGARQNAEATAPGQIAVESIESFVGQNIEELSTFSKNRIPNGVRRLLETYNERVDTVEADKSVLVEVPPNLFSSSEV
jgi:hypothetical protein